MPDAKRKPFARIPLEILKDARLTGTDIRVFSFLAVKCRNNNVAIVSPRAIAKDANMSDRQVWRCINNLGAAGWLSRPIKPTLGKLSVFVINHPLFGHDPKAPSVTPTSLLSETPMSYILETVLESPPKRSAKLVSFPKSKTSA